jgi:hypothetical protein
MLQLFVFPQTDGIEKEESEILLQQSVDWMRRTNTAALKSPDRGTTGFSCGNL